MTLLLLYNQSIAVALLAAWFHNITVVLAQPNIIVMQPDDLIMYEEWDPPAHFPNSPNSWFARNPPPNMERLRTRGLEMRQAYTSSSMCGTSRYSTLTGRYPSRSAQGRDLNWGADISWASIRYTRLEDRPSIPDGMDCSENNLAALLQRNGYRTGVMGKWHLFDSPPPNFDYEQYKRDVRSCGWDVAEAIYPENLNGFWTDGTFSHNLEYLTAHAVKFIEESNEPFFLYFNPTAPHDSGDVYEALTVYDCTDTPEGQVDSDFVNTIPGMTDGYPTCQAYRNSVISRAGSQNQNTLGAIWIDDTIGSLFLALEDKGVLDDTLFLFQLDHGEEGKTSLWEPGVRIAQFIHYPAEFGTSGSRWSGLVSTIDVAPTLADFAGVSSLYNMDGASWKDAVIEGGQLGFWRDERCLAFELYDDRAIRCGCYKYMGLWRNPFAGWAGVADGYDMLFDLCQGGLISVSAPGSSPEADDVAFDYPDIFQRFLELYNEHLDKTYASNRSPIDYSPLIY